MKVKEKFLLWIFILIQIPSILGFIIDFFDFKIDYSIGKYIIIYFLLLHVYFNVTFMILNRVWNKEVKLRKTLFLLSALSCIIWGLTVIYMIKIGASE